MVSKVLIDGLNESNIRRDKVIYSVIQGLQNTIKESKEINTKENLNNIIKALETIVG